ncbi:MAG: riboflavin synthase [Thermoplasmatota archaeon]
MRVGVVDTTFSRVDMGKVAVATLAKVAPTLAVERATVPGVKDLPAAARAFFDAGADAVIACGMVGGEDIDKICGHEASLGLMHLRVLFGKPLLEVFVHMDEVTRDADLRWLAEERTREHAINCAWMLVSPEKLVALAGTGQRQGFADAGPAPDAPASRGTEGGPSSLTSAAKPRRACSAPPIPRAGRARRAIDRVKVPGFRGTPSSPRNGNGRKARRRSSRPSKEE